MKSWIDREAALAVLRVRPQTLYAYVSRGRIRMQPDPEDARRSLYSAEDIAQQASTRARGRRPAAIAASSMAWGEPAIATALSTSIRGRLFYRGRDVGALAGSATLEDVAACYGTMPARSASRARAVAAPARSKRWPPWSPAPGP